MDSTTKSYKDKFIGKPKVRFDCMSCPPCDSVGVICPLPIPLPDNIIKKYSHVCITSLERT